MSEQTGPGRTARTLPWLALVLGLVLVAGLIATRLSVDTVPETYLPPTGPYSFPAGNPEPTRPQSACPVAPQGAKATASAAAVLAGGRLQLPVGAVPYATGPRTITSVPMATDVTSYIQSFTDHPGWVEEFSLGQIARGGRFADLESSARAVVDCVVTNPDAYTKTPTAGPTTVTVRKVGTWDAVLAAVDLVLDPKVSSGVTSKRLFALVVDDGRTDSWSLLFASAMGDKPQDAARILAAMDQLAPR
jgi:hypothetical protein